MDLEIGDTVWCVEDYRHIREQRVHHKVENEYVDDLWMLCNPKHDTLWREAKERDIFKNPSDALTELERRVLQHICAVVEKLESERRWVEKQTTNSKGEVAG